MAEKSRAELKLSTLNRRVVDLNKAMERPLESYYRHSILEELTRLKAVIKELEKEI